MCKRVRIVFAEGIWCLGRSAADVAIDLMEGHMQAGSQFFGPGACVRRAVFLQPADIAHRRDQVQHQGMPFYGKRAQRRERRCLRRHLDDIGLYSASARGGEEFIQNATDVKAVLESAHKQRILVTRALQLMLKSHLHRPAFDPHRRLTHCF